MGQNAVLSRLEMWFMGQKAVLSRFEIWVVGQKVVLSRTEIWVMGQKAVLSRLGMWVMGQKAVLSRIEMWILGQKAGLSRLQIFKGQNGLFVKTCNGDDGIRLETWNQWDKKAQVVVHSTFYATGQAAMTCNSKHSLTHPPTHTQLRTTQGRLCS